MRQIPQGGFVDLSSYREARADAGPVSRLLTPEELARLAGLRIKQVQAERELVFEAKLARFRATGSTEPKPEAKPAQPNASNVGDAGSGAGEAKAPPQIAV